jgi:DNA mismatch endonuclease (patch repair protein)
LFKWPATRHEFWKQKINRNHENDLLALNELQTTGWRVCIVWECSIKGTDKDTQAIAKAIGHWLASTVAMLEISR